jgi:hypothetical protein
MRTTLPLAIATLAITTAAQSQVLIDMPPPPKPASTSADTGELALARFARSRRGPDYADFVTPVYGYPYYGAYRSYDAWNWGWPGPGWGWWGISCVRPCAPRSCGDRPGRPL